MTSHQIICELRRDAEKETARRIKAEKVLIDHGYAKHTLKIQIP